MKPADFAICPPDLNATISRRQLVLSGAAGLLLPTGWFAQLALAAEGGGRAQPHHDHLIDDEETCWWDGQRQIVVAYQRGQTMGEPCRQLDAVKEKLPVKIQWRLPPPWVKIFPTIQFKTSSGQWELYEGWSQIDAFTQAYEQFNPPEKSDRDISPFKEFVQRYDAPRWTWPGRITDHLLDPNGPHRFSEYELRGLKTSEKKRLHTAHHNHVIQPGHRPPRVQGEG